MIPVVAATLAASPDADRPVITGIVDENLKKAAGILDAMWCVAPRERIGLDVAEDHLRALQRRVQPGPMSAPDPRHDTVRSERRCFFMEWFVFVDD
jgi:hypothetical protein